MRGPEIPVRDFLANLPLFKDLDAAEIDRIGAATRRVYAARGEVLFHRGEMPEGFHVVLYGRVKLAFTSPQGGEKVVEILGPGATFGEAVAFMEQPYPVSAQTLADSLLLLVTKQVIFAEIESSPLFARRMIAGLSVRLHRLVRDVESYSLRSGAQRVVGYLLGEEGIDGKGVGAVTITLPASKVVIASRLNLTPEHFSRILHELIEEGLIEVDHRHIRIPDLAKLRAV